VDVPVLDVQPAVFTSGGTQAIAIHANDFTLATGERPLQPGEFATVYATGLGSVAGPPATGAALTGVASVTGTVEVLVGGVVAELQYAGLAPGFVGVYQVNFRVPELQGPQDLVISAGGTSSPPVRLTIR
jgi:uncharacterized protein (TIGR03437 family)